MAYFTSENVADQMTAIRTFSGEYLYLIEGDTRAILVDTGIGAGSLRDCIQMLTPKPVTVVLTHGHADHALGVSEFERVYLNHSDLPLYRRQCREEERLGYLKTTLGKRFTELPPSDFVPLDPEKTFYELRDETHFNLGGLHVRAIAFPGHTAGSMALLVEEPGLLILGDACNSFTFLFDNDSSSVEAYRASLTAIQERLRGRFDRVFLSHGSPETDSGIMNNVLAVCNDILADTADDAPYCFRGLNACAAKAFDSRLVRRDGKVGNVVYSKEKIWN